MGRFHEIHTEREPDSIAGEALTRRSFQCLDAPGVTVFVWQRGAVVEQVQLLFDEQFVEWRSDRALRAGSQQRERERGVRSLVAGAGCDLAVARALLAQHEFPDDVVAPLRAALG